MCFAIAPVLAAVSLATTVASGVVGYMGQQQQGAAEQAQLNYNAQVSRNNSVLRQQDATRIAQEGEVAAQKQQQERAQAVARARASAAASGVDPNSGSPLDVQADLTKIGKLDEDTTRYNALVNRRNALIESDNLASQSQLLTAESANVKKATRLAGYSSLLSTASSFGDKFMAFQKDGVFG